MAPPLSRLRERGRGEGMHPRWSLFRTARPLLPGCLRQPTLSRSGERVSERRTSLSPHAEEPASAGVSSVHWILLRGAPFERSSRRRGVMS
jgi:hypothetical protein